MPDVIRSNLIDSAEDISKDEIASIGQFLKKKYKKSQVEVVIQEVESHDRIRKLVENPSLQILNNLNMHAIDYLGNYSLNNVFTSRGDNRLRDTAGAVFYVMESHTSIQSKKVTIQLTLMKSINVINFLENEVRTRTTKQQGTPTYAVRILKRSLVFAYQENKGDLTDDIVDMKEDVLA